MEITNSVARRRIMNCRSALIVVVVALASMAQGQIPVIDDPSD